MNSSRPFERSGESEICDARRVRTQARRIPLRTSLLVSLYSIESRALRRLIRSLLSKLEKGEIYSLGLREIFRRYYKVEIGMYSHGWCFVPGEFDPMTSVGRYCSIARGARVIRTNHPLEFRSTHGFFFNSRLGFSPEGLMRYQPLHIGNDVWLGANALILPHVKTIGDGAVIAAGAVVGKDVPPYAIAVGNPARVVRFRFSKEKIEELLASRWWEKPIDELDIQEFCKPFSLSGDPEEVA